MSKRAREQESTKRARLSTACFRFHKHGCDVSKAWLLEAYRLLPAEAARQCHCSRKQPPCRSRGFALAPTARQHQNRCSDEDEALERSTSLAALDRPCCACSQERGTSLAALPRSAAPAVLQNQFALAACCSTSLCWQLPATRQVAHRIALRTASFHTAGKQSGPRFRRGALSDKESCSMPVQARVFSAIYRMLQSLFVPGYFLVE